MESSTLPISPNRSVLDGVATGGNDLVVVYNTSSVAFYPRVRASSSIDGAAWTATACMARARRSPIYPPIAGLAGR